MYPSNVTLIVDAFKASVPQDELFKPRFISLITQFYLEKYNTFVKAHLSYELRNYRAF